MFYSEQLELLTIVIYNYLEFCHQTLLYKVHQKNHLEQHHPLVVGSFSKYIYKTSCRQFPSGSCINLSLSNFSTQKLMLPTQNLLLKSIKNLSFYLKTSVNSAFLSLKHGIFHCRMLHLVFPYSDQYLIFKKYMNYDLVVHKVFFQKVGLELFFLEFVLAK